MEITSKFGDHPTLTGLSFEQRLAKGAEGRYLTSQYGSCMRCQMRWNEVEGHATPYGEGGSRCFPLCEECWIELTPETRLPFYSALWSQWQASIQRHRIDDSDDYIPERWESLRSNVLAGL